MVLEPHFGTLLYNKISHSLVLFLDEGKTFPKTVLSWSSVFPRKNNLQRMKNAEKHLDISQECDYISSWVPEKKTKKNIEAYRFFLIFHFSDIAAQLVEENTNWRSGMCFKFSGHHFVKYFDIIISFSVGTLCGHLSLTLLTIDVSGAITKNAGINTYQ